MSAELVLLLSILFLGHEILRVEGDGGGCCDNPKIPASYTGDPTKYEGLYCRDEFADCNKTEKADKISCGRDEDGKWTASPIGYCQGSDICKRDPNDEDNVFCEHPDGPDHSFVKCECPNEHPHLVGQPTEPGASPTETVIPNDPSEVLYCGHELNKVMNYTEYPYCPPTSIISCQKEDVEETKCPKNCEIDSTDKMKRNCV